MESDNHIVEAYLTIHLLFHIQGARMRETGESSRGKKNKAFLAIKKEIEEKERQRRGKGRGWSVDTW